MQEQPILICCVVGPTASGKTDLAVELAKKNNGEIISFDSMQVYKDAPIATAVPTLEERQGIPHHLMEFLDGNQTFSVAKFLELVRPIILDVHSRGNLPILVGGTGLYYSSLVDNLQFTNQSDQHLAVRKQLEERLAEEGVGSLYDELCKVDPQAAERIHINNHIRVIRALEIYYTTGKTMSQQVEESRGIPSPYKPCVIGLTYRDREKLYDRINLRVHKMLDAGMLKEAEAIYQKHPDGTLIQAIGLKELYPYFAGECSLADAVEKIQMESRRYAKRQLTWFRRDERVHWLYRDEVANDQLVDEAQSVLSSYLDQQ